MQTNTNQEFESKISSIDSVSVLLSYHICFSSAGMTLYDVMFFHSFFYGTDIYWVPNMLQALY